MKGFFRLSRQPELQSPALIVGWSTDAAKLGLRVTDYLNKKLGGQSFGEIEPAGFFLLGGVTIEDDLIQFPESRFYYCPENDLVIFKSAPPSYEWYKFLDLVLDVAERHCQAKAIYTIGGIVSPGAHTAPRQLLATFNSPELKEDLSQYDLDRNLYYQTPRGHRPTINSFLFWLAKRRNIPGFALWVPVPFYLVAAEDPKAQKKVLEFLNQRFDLGIDLHDLDEEIRTQDEKIDQMRVHLPEVDEYIRKSESNLRLSEEENEKLVKEIERFLREEDNN